jgi:hypothetical protein
MTAKTADGLDPRSTPAGRPRLKNPAKDHPFLENTTPGGVQALVNRILADRRGMEEAATSSSSAAPRACATNPPASGPTSNRCPFLSTTSGATSPRIPTGRTSLLRRRHLLFRRKEIDRWLSPLWKAEHDRLRRELEQLQDALPAQYPFLHTLKDADKPANAKVAIRGDEQNLGEEAPRRLLSALCENEPRPFTQGSGRAELADAILSHPLAARVIVDRVWQGHFGAGIVASPSNFGQLGERPTHPALLDALAAGFVADG